MASLCSIAWTSAVVPLELQTGSGGPHLQKGGTSVCSIYHWITVFCLPGKVYARVLRVQSGRLLNNVVLVLGMEQRTSSLHFSGCLRVLEGVWEFPKPVHVFCGSRRRLMIPCAPRYHVLVQSLKRQSVNLVCMAGSKTELFLL